MTVEHSGLRRHELPPDQTTICLVPGDGVGPEVTYAAAEVLGALGLGLRFVEASAGFEHFTRTGNAIPDETLADIRQAGIALFGATSSPSHVEPQYKSPIIVFRKTFELFANLRPTLSLPGSFSRPNIDLLIVRENTEGLYAGRERYSDATQTAAIAERVITKAASERIARAAFEEGNSRRQNIGFEQKISDVTIVHKANVLKITDGLFRATCMEVAKEFPNVRAGEMLVDTMAMRLVRDPEHFNVIVTTNMFGDILSDEASGLIGGLGVAPSANIGPHVAVYEPVHGSAPDIAGKGIANPIGAILSAAMLLDHINQPGAAQRVRLAVEETVRSGILTPDLGGTAKTKEVTRNIIQHL